jgi:four helix bundle protein
MDARELEKRTKMLGLRCLRLADSLPAAKPSARALAGQLSRSGTSIGANYRAATRARSRAEFVAKISIVLEECDETAFWLEMIIESGLYKQTVIKPLLDETMELLAIFAKSRMTLKINMNRSPRENRPIAKSPECQIPK